MAALLPFFSSDASVLDRIREGDEQVLAELYRSNKRSIASLVLRNGGDESDADDVLQESVVILWERVRTGRFEQTAKLSTFLFAVAKNVWSRKRMRKHREPAFDEPDTLSDDAHSSVLDGMIDDERSYHISRALDRLGDPCRTLLVLYYWEERSQEEIADTMGFANAATVKSKKYTCKKMLEKILQDDGLRTGTEW